MHRDRSNSSDSDRWRSFRQMGAAAGCRHGNGRNFGHGNSVACSGYVGPDIRKPADISSLDWRSSCYLPGGASGDDVRAFSDAGKDDWLVGELFICRCGIRRVCTLYQRVPHRPFRKQRRAKLLFSNSGRNFPYRIDSDTACRDSGSPRWLEGGGP